MDERHWWIAGKIQESFKIGGYENPSLLEDFMCEESTLGIVNRFLKAGGPCRLFFYCQNRDSGVLSTNELYVTGNLAALKDSDLEKVRVNLMQIYVYVYASLFVYNLFFIIRKCITFEIM